MLDYDKKFLLASLDNLTFDGSSIRGFSQQHESDLRLDIDWTSFRSLPSDVFGDGKVVVFANVLNRDKTPYQSDFRAQPVWPLLKVKRNARSALRSLAAFNATRPASLTSQIDPKL